MTFCCFSAFLSTFSLTVLICWADWSSCAPMSCDKHASPSCYDFRDCAEINISFGWPQRLKMRCGARKEWLSHSPLPCCLGLSEAYPFDLSFCPPPPCCLQPLRFLPRLHHREGRLITHTKKQKVSCQHQQRDTHNLVGSTSCAAANRTDSGVSEPLWAASRSTTTLGTHPL